MDATDLMRLVLESSPEGLDWIWESRNPGRRGRGRSRNRPRHKGRVGKGYGHLLLAGW
jgi:hypothetical protein